ncbi:MAG: hypothetical protein RSA70_07180, partial [Clostridia bacterium]
MGLNEQKINAYADNVKSLSNYPSDDGITADKLKAIFDGRGDKEIKTSINGIIDALKATSGAAEIGSVGGNVQTALDDKPSFSYLACKVDKYNPQVTGTITASNAADGPAALCLLGGNNTANSRIEMDSICKALNLTVNPLGASYTHFARLALSSDGLSLTIDGTVYPIYTGYNKPSKEDIGLAHVDDTSDSHKPISKETQDALNGKLDKAYGVGRLFFSFEKYPPEMLANDTWYV